MERFDYLKKRPIWVQLNDDFLRVIVQAFENQSDDYFTQFIALCEKQQLPEDKFLKIEKENEKECYAYLLATAIHETGTHLMSQSIKGGEQDTVVIAMLCNFFSTLLDPLYFPGFISLACGFARGQNYEQALIYLDEGQKAYQSLKNDEVNINRFQKISVDAFDAALISKLREEFSSK